MAAGKVGQYSIGAFGHPANGEDLDASIVMGNDNTVGSTYNQHDADPTIHVQSSTLAQRPAAGIAQRVYVTTDGYRIYLDTGTAWQELAYLSSAGGTVAGDLLFTDNLYDIGKSGATRPRDGFFARNVTVGGAITLSDGNALQSGGVVLIKGSGTAVQVGTAGGSSVLLNSSNSVLVPFSYFAAGNYAGSNWSAGAIVSRTSATTGEYRFGEGTTPVLSYTGSAFVLGGGSFLFAVDNGFDIGASGSNRPRNLYIASALNVGATISVGGAIDTNGFLQLNVPAISFVAGYVGAAQTSGSLILASAQGDLCLRANNRAIRFSVDAGATQVAAFAPNLFSVNGAITFGTDNAFDIGASAANRPRNIYAAGSIFSASSRALKEQVRPTRVDALALVRGVRVVDFRYRANPARQKIGFIAEDTDELLSGPAHKDFDLNNAIGLLLRAVQQLDERVAMVA